MDKSYRRLLTNKNPHDNQSLALFNNTFQCSKCKKYNSITYENTSTPRNFQNCLYCSNPSYVKINK